MADGSHIIFHVLLYAAPAPTTKPAPLNSSSQIPAGPAQRLLSIVTPAFNAREFLPALIESVAAMPSPSAFEWVLVDDGSSDDTAALFETAAKSHPNWRLLKQTNKGVAAARNRGLDEATGTYIWFVDADDLVVPNGFAVLLAAASESPDLVAFQAARFASGEADSTVFKATKPQAAVGQDWVTLLIRQKEWRHFLWQYWYRRQFLHACAIRFAEGLIHEDIAVVTAAALNASRVRYVDQIAYRYRTNPSSLTNSRNQQQLMSRIDSYFVVIEQLREINRRTFIRPDTRRLLQGEIVGQALQVFELAKQLGHAGLQRQVIEKARGRRFAQGLIADVNGFKRFRQVAAIWLKQMGFLSIGTQQGIR